MVLTAAFKANTLCIDPPINMVFKNIFLFSYFLTLFVLSRCIVTYACQKLSGYLFSVTKHIVNEIINKFSCDGVHEEDVPSIFVSLVETAVNFKLGPKSTSYAIGTCKISVRSSESSSHHVIACMSDVNEERKVPLILKFKGK